MKLEELVNCLRSDSESDNESDTSSLNEEGIIVEFHQKLEIVEEERTVDKQTNTECAFYPEHAKHKKMMAKNQVMSDDKLIFIKRSQTFSPSAVVSKNHYICKLNRSDSDSSMPLYRRGPFQRNSVERRSLRRRQSNSMAALTKVRHSQVTARTSLDLELDLQVRFFNQILKIFLVSDLVKLLC